MTLTQTQTGAPCHACDIYPCMPKRKICSGCAEDLKQTMKDFFWDGLTEWTGLLCCMAFYVACVWDFMRLLDWIGVI